MSFLLFLAAGVAAEPPEAPPQSAETELSRAELLDSEYASHDYTELTRLLFEPASEEEAVIGLDWLGLRFRDDGSAYISQAYSTLLQAFADQYPPAEAQSLRGTALTAMASAVLNAHIDGVQCGDISARNELATRLIDELQSSGLRSIDVDVRRQAGWIALNNERMTWEHRQNLDQSAHLCAGGLMAMMAGMLASAPVERAPVNGEIGRQFDVAIPEEFEFDRRANDEWFPEAEARRENAEDLLKTILGVESIFSLEEVEDLIAARE